jgi:hypothetical protein
MNMIGSKTIQNFFDILNYFECNQAIRTSEVVQQAIEQEIDS